MEGRSGAAVNDVNQSVLLRSRIVMLMAWDAGKLEVP